MSNENEKIKVEEAKQVNSVNVENEKSKQPKVKKAKSTARKIFDAIIISLIIGIIGGAVSLYFIQEKTDIWFLIPSSLTKKLEVSNEKDKNKETNNKVNENVTEKNTENNEENKLLTMDEAYKTLEELYNVAVDMYLHFPCNKFTVDANSHPTTSASAVEVTDYEKVMTKYFTQAAKAQYEDYASNGIIEENDKVYMESADGVIGLDYLTTVFTKVEISENEIICIVDNMYNENFDAMYNVAENDETLNKVEVKIKHIESKFTIKKVNDKWKIDTFDYQKAM